MILLAAAAALLVSCSGNIPLTQENVAELMNRLNKASMKEDFDSMDSCYSRDAEIEISKGKEGRKLTVRDFIEQIKANAKNVTEYVYDPQPDINIEIEGGEATVKQTVIESALAKGEPIRSKTEAIYKVRSVRGKVRIVSVNAKVIIARVASPMELSAGEEGI